MTHHVAHPSLRTGTHVVLAILVLATIVAAVRLPAVLPALGSVAIAVVVLHLAIVGAVFAVLVRTGGTSAVGHTLHSGRVYDAFVGLYTLGREGRLRGRTLDAAAVTAGDRVLDVCCGTGTLTLAARARVGEAGSVQGVDASPEMIARATHKGGHTDVAFHVAQAQALPFPDGSFDVVLCSFGFHHLPEDARGTALAEMRRVLAPGGRVLVVEYLRERNVLALANPIAWLHGTLRHPVVAEAAVGLTRAGLDDVTTAALGFRGIGYARGVRRS